MKTHTPLQIQGINDSLYGGFWQRLGAFLLDLIPLGILGSLLGRLNLDPTIFSIVTFVVSLLHVICYFIYLPKRFGGTPGKLIVGLKILRSDGEAIGWKEAILRYLGFWLAFYVISITMFLTFRAENPELSSWILSISSIWYLALLIVLFVNKKRRTIHDLGAKTVIVKSKYIDQIRQAMQEAQENQDTNTTEDEWTSRRVLTGVFVGLILSILIINWFGGAEWEFQDGAVAPCEVGATERTEFSIEEIEELADADVSPVPKERTEFSVEEIEKAFFAGWPDPNVWRDMWESSPPRVVTAERIENTRGNRIFIEGAGEYVDVSNSLLFRMVFQFEDGREFEAEHFFQVRAGELQLQTNTIGCTR